MMKCVACGHESPAVSNFCAHCGAAMLQPGVPTIEERKVVTVLFCDLVGFTEVSESADPEDVRHMLSSYFTMARKHIHDYGGVVEKFIGDAVVGVFGVPAGHEDDPERAVRAAHRMIEDVEQLRAVDSRPLKLRVGINTGEVLVRMGSSAGDVEGFVTGDAINTASRLQSIAPEMGVAVGLATYLATSAVINYTELPPVSVKGKSAPLQVFLATSPRARMSADLGRTHDAPLVGRHLDLALMKGVFSKSLEEETVQAVTVVGEPGLGKSRLIAELARYVDSRPELVNWRQGRCLPYGEGITFWALSDIVKSHAGILESDPARVAALKLAKVLPDGPEREWFHQRLLPLIGVEASSGAQRPELFTAWRRFLEYIASTDPTVVVFEDLHWADDAMLEFLVHLASQAEGVPLLVVGTTRPELLDEHPRFATWMRENATIHLAPLSERETARLISGLLGSARLPDEVQHSVVERSGGNPLYAEEFVRLLKDRDLLVAQGPQWQLVEDAEVPVSDSVHALISARLDGLGHEEKSVLTDASVIGTVFWAGALAQMADRSKAAVVAVLERLAHKELVRSVRQSAFEGEREYTFVHSLVREVAYSHLPRAARASRHVVAARWIEAKAPARVEDVADVLAHHYATALELARAADDVELAHQLEAPTLHFLTLAGERALGLNTGAALTSFERALDLTPLGHPDRSGTLTHWAEALADVGRYADAAAPLEEAIPALMASGNLPEAAAAMTQLSTTLSRLGDPRWATLSAQEVEILSPLPPGPQLVEALASLAMDEALQGRALTGRAHADHALALAEELGLPRPARALGYRGVARCLLGEIGGTDDMREAIALATKAGQGEGVAMLHNNLGMALWTLEGPEAALSVLRAGISFAEPRGLAGWVVTISASTLDCLTDMGAFDEACNLANLLVEHLQDSGDVFDLMGVRTVLIRVLTLRGQLEGVRDDVVWVESIAREQGSAEDVVIGLGSAALARVALGEDQAAIGLLAEVSATAGARDTQYYPALLPAMVRAAISLERLDLARRLADGVEARYLYTQHALLAADAALVEAMGDISHARDLYADAEGRWHAFGVVPERAFALLGLGRCLVAENRDAEGEKATREARVLFAGLGAASLGNSGR